MRKFNADTTFKNALTDGLHYEQAPQNTDGSYCVFYIIGGSNDEIMGDAEDCIKNLDLQFNLFSNVLDGGGTMALLKKLLSACYDWVFLNVTGFGCIKMEPVSWVALPITDGWRQMTVIYELGIQKE